MNFSSLCYRTTSQYISTTWQFDHSMMSGYRHSSSQLVKLLFYNHSTKVSLSHLRTTTTSFRTTGLSRMQRAKNQLVLTSQLGLTPLGIPSLFRALPTRGNPLTFYHILIVDGYFTAVDIDGTKNNSLRCPGVVVGCQLFDFFYNL